MVLALTDDELDLLEQTANVWNAFLRLPSQHNDEVAEFRHALHALQRIIMVRPVQRIGLGL